MLLLGARVFLVVANGCNSIPGRLEGVVLSPNDHLPRALCHILREKLDISVSHYGLYFWLLL